MSQQIVSTWDGVQNTNSWVHDGDVERSAVDIVELASSVAGYSAGAQAAADAASGYADTASAAVASIGTAATDAVAAVQSAGNAEINDLYSAADAETSAMVAVGSSWINTLTSSGGIVTSAVGDAGTAQILAITSAGGAQVSLVSAAGGSAIGDLAAVTAAQSAALVSAGGYQAGLVASAGTATIALVQAEGATQTAAISASVASQVNIATSAAIVATSAATVASSTVSALTSAGSAQIALVNSAGAAQSAALVSAGGVQVSLVESAGATQSSLVVSTGAAQSAFVVSTGATQSAVVTSAGGAQITAVNSAGAVQSAAVVSAGTEQIALVHSAGAAEVQAIEDAGEVYQAQIDALDTKTDITDKRVDNLAALMNGALSVQNTDSTSAYSKVIPAKAQPYAAIDAIGGKTVCWNQLVTNGNFATTSNWSLNSLSMTVADNVATFEVTAQASFVSFYQVVPATEGHKYLATIDLRTDSETARYLTLAVMSKIVYENVSENWTTVATIVESPTPGNKTINPGMNYPIASAAVIGDKIYARNARLVDLTLLYGAGNEPSTVAEFQQMFPTIDPAYNPGQLISAGVTGAVSYPHNIAIPSVINATSNHAYLDADIIRRHFISPGDCLTVYVYKMSDGTSIGNECALVFWKDSTQLTSATTGPNRHIYFQSGAQGGTDINLASLTPDYNKVSLYVSASAKNIDLGVVIVAGATTITQYVSSRTPSTLPIPAAVQQLPGYGWSAGSVYNEVDWQNKKYIQRVGSATFNGSENWTKSGGALNGYFIYMFEPPYNKKVGGQVVCQMAIAVSDLAEYLNTYYTCYSDSAFAINLPETLCGNTVQTFKAWLSSNTLTVYYELETPIETDISSLLSDDNLIAVEPGGTMTFPNQLGDDYRLPVPSDVEYTIDMAPDTPSTDGTYTLQCVVADGVPTYSWVSA